MECLLCMLALSIMSFTFEGNILARSEVIIIPHVLKLLSLLADVVGTEEFFVNNLNSVGYCSLCSNHHFFFSN